MKFSASVAAIFTSIPPIPASKEGTKENIEEKKEKPRHGEFVRRKKAV